MNLLELLSRIDSVGFFFGALIGLAVGIFIGYLVWNRRKTQKSAEKQVTQIHITFLVAFFGYILTPLIGLPEPQPAVAITILAIASGEAIGTGVAKALEKYTSVESNKNRSKK